MPGVQAQKCGRAGTRYGSGVAGLPIYALCFWVSLSILGTKDLEGVYLQHRGEDILGGVECIADDIVGLRTLFRKQMNILANYASTKHLS